MKQDIGVGTAGSQTCVQCGRAFIPRRTGGRAQRFCSPSCRRTFDAVVRAKGRAEIANDLPAAPGIANRDEPTRALADSPNEASLAGHEEDTDDGVFMEPIARFVIEVPLQTIEGLVRLGFIGRGKQDDLAAIIAALNRIGRIPSISRIE